MTLYTSSKIQDLAKSMLEVQARIENGPMNIYWLRKNHETCKQHLEVNQDSRYKLKQDTRFLKGGWRLQTTDKKIWSSKTHYTLMINTVFYIPIGRFIHRLIDRSQHQIITNLGLNWVLILFQKIARLRQAAIAIYHIVCNELYSIHCILWILFFA